MNETIDNQQPSSVAKLGWLAGIIDGEGCLQLAKQKYKDRFHFRPQIVIGNNNPKIINQIILVARENDLPVYVIDRHYASKSAVSTTQVIQVMGLKRLKKWIDVIIPYLVGKKEQAEIISKYIEYRMSQPLPFKGSNSFGEKDFEYKQLLNNANHQYRTRTVQRLNAEQTS